MRFINLTITILFVFFFVIARAQYSDSTKYHALLATSGSANKTTDNRAYLLNNSFIFGIKTKSVAFNATNTWIYGKQNSTTTNNDFSSVMFFNLYKTFRHFYYWGLLNYNTSYSLKVNSQVLSGIGIAYSIVDSNNAYINFSDGILYDKSNLLVNKDYHIFRNSFRVQYRFVIKKMITVEGSNYYQKSLSAGNDYIIRSNTTFGIKIKKWLSLATTFTYNRMNITNSDNLNFTYGLIADKWF